jgi:NitT/TauT family transport system permease protein
MAYLENARKRSKTGYLNTILTSTDFNSYTLFLERYFALFIIIILLGIWELLIYTKIHSGLFFPAPSFIAHTLIKMIIKGELISHLAATLSRLLLGFAVGFVPGLVLGLLMGWSNRIKNMIDPVIASVHPIPKISVLPLIMIFFGIGETSKIVVVAIAAFFPMVINTMEGVRQIPPLYFEVAENYGANSLKMFKKVIIPGSLPLILAGIRLSLNNALLLTIAVELITAHKGLGALIWSAWETLRTEELYVGLVVTAILGIGINALLQRITKLFLPWKEYQNTQ